MQGPMYKQSLTDFLRRRLERVTASCGGWGSPDATENQVLTLLEVYTVAMECPSRLATTTARYTRYLHQATGLAGPQNLASRLGLLEWSECAAQNERFLQILRGFVQQELREIDEDEE